MEFEHYRNLFLLALVISILIKGTQFFWNGLNYKQREHLTGILAYVGNFLTLVFVSTAVVYGLSIFIRYA